MKLLKLTALSIFAASILSCGSDDGGTPFELTEEIFVGTYTMTDYEITTTTTGEVAGTEVVFEREETDEELENVELTFSAPNTYSADGFIRRKIEENGEVIVESETLNAETTGSYSLDVENNEIMFTPDDLTTDFVLDGSFSLDASASSLTIVKEEESTNADGDSVVIVESFSFSKN